MEYSDTSPAAFCRAALPLRSGQTCHGYSADLSSAAIQFMKKDEGTEHTGGQW